MATLKSFQARVRRRARLLPIQAGEVVDEVAIGVTGALAEGTPVDTGLAQGNWLVRRGGPDLSERAPRSPAETVAEASRALGGRATKEGEEVFVANGGEKVPYLSLLNNGSSQQAPAGFVQAAVSVGLNIARRARVTAGRGTFSARRS